MDPIRKLSDAELDIMLAIWKAGGPVQRSYLDEEMRVPHNWAETTILTILSKLIEKGFLSCVRQGKCNVYTPIVSKEEYTACANRRYLQKFYGSSVGSFVAALADSHDLTDRDLADLQHFLDSFSDAAAT